MNLSDLGKMLIILAVALLAIGLVMYLLGQAKLPKLPGDIFIRRGNFTVYIPIVTSIIISIILTLILNLLLRR